MTVLSRTLLAFAAAVLAVSVASAETGYSKDEPFPTHSWEDFRKLDPDQQRQYIEDMRVLFGKFSELGVVDSASLWEGFVPPEKWSLLMGLIERARAAATANCSDNMFAILPSNGGRAARICIAGSYTGFKGMAYDCSESGQSHVHQLAVQCASQFQSFANTPTNIQGKPIEGQMANIARQRAAEFQKEALAKAPAVPAAAKEEAAKVAPIATEVKKTDFRCIYAGFAMEGRKKEDCHAVSTWKGINSRCMMQEFKCPSGDSAAAPAKKGKRKAKKSRGSCKSDVLCNPALYGVSATKGLVDEPICVCRGSSASKACEAVANKNKKESLTKAAQIAFENKAEFERLNSVSKMICEDGKEKTDYLNSFSKEELSEASRKDIEETCVAFGRSFKPVRDAVTGGTSGQN